MCIGERLLCFFLALCHLYARMHMVAEAGFLDSAFFIHYLELHVYKDIKG